MADTAALMQLKQNQNTIKNFMARMNKISRSYEKRQRAAAITMEKNADRLADSHDKLVKAIDRNTAALLKKRDFPKPPEPRREPDIKMNQQVLVYMTCQCHCEKSSGSGSSSKSSAPLKFEVAKREDVFKNIKDKEKKKDDKKDAKSPAQKADEKKKTTVDRFFVPEQQTPGGGLLVGNPEPEKNDPVKIAAEKDDLFKKMFPEKPVEFKPVGSGAQAQKAGFDALSNSGFGDLGFEIPEAPSWGEVFSRAKDALEKKIKALDENWKPDVKMSPGFEDPSFGDLDFEIPEAPSWGEVFSRAKDALEKKIKALDEKWKPDFKLPPGFDDPGFGDLGFEIPKGPSLGDLFPDVKSSIEKKMNTLKGNVSPNGGDAGSLTAQNDSLLKKQLADTANGLDEMQRSSCDAAAEMDRLRRQIPQSGDGIVNPEDQLIMPPVAPSSGGAESKAAEEHADRFTKPADAITGGAAEIGSGADALKASCNAVNEAAETLAANGDKISDAHDSLEYSLGYLGPSAAPATEPEQDIYDFMYGDIDDFSGKAFQHIEEAVITGGEMIRDAFSDTTENMRNVEIPAMQEDFWDSFNIEDVVQASEEAFAAAKEQICGTMETVKASASSAFSTIENKAAEGIENSVDQISANMEKAVDGVTEKIKEASDAMEEFGKKSEESKGKVKSLKDHVNEFAEKILGKTLAGKLMSLFTLANAKKVFNWAIEVSGLSLDQQMVELKLKTVMEYGGGTAEQYEAIKDRAVELQGTTTYTDNVIMAGAAELFKETGDAKATSTLMGTLANFATMASGGGAVDASGMASYASDLAKAMEGDYAALEAQGIRLSNVQKDNIANANAANKALMLDEIITQSWGDLAENMAKTPTGIISQIKNDILSLKEGFGAQLMPALTQFMSGIQEGLPFAAILFQNLVNVLQVVFTVLGAVAGVVGMIAGFFADNWSIIEPIIWGLVAAFLAYNAVLGAGWLLTLQNAAAMVAKTIADGAAAAATAIMTIAQQGLNAALMACPIVWIILAVILLIAAFYAVVAAVNKFTGNTLSATGLILGAIAYAAAWIWNTIIDVLGAILNFLWTYFAEPILGIIEWILNAMNGGFDSFGGMVANLIGKIVSWFLTLGTVVTKIIDAIFKTNWTAGLEALKGEVFNWGKGEGYVELELGEPDLSGLKVDPDEWGDAGYKFGEGIDNGIGDFFSGGAGFGGGGFNEMPGNIEDIADNMGSIADNTGNTAANTAAANNNMERSSEDLKYMRLLAEREAVNRYMTSEITVNQTNNNRIDSGLDVDGILSAFTEDFAEKLEISAEGVYA